MEVEDGVNVRFYVRYGGAGGLQPGFSLGITVDEPQNAAVSIREEGVTYFIEENDLWYFDGHDLLVSVDERSSELTYQYE